MKYEAMIAREIGLRNHKPLFYYDYKVVPVSEEAKYSFALTLHDRSGNRIPFNKLEITKMYSDFDNPVFAGRAAFFHENECENETAYKSRIVTLAEFKMTQSNVKGFSSDFLSNGFTSLTKQNGGPHRLILDRDYKIEIGERQYYEQVPELTFSDIKAL